MKRLAYRTVRLATCMLTLLTALAGCGGGKQAISVNPNPQPTSVIFVAAPSASLAVNASTTIDAAAVFPNAPGTSAQNSSVTYSLTCGSPSACGTLSPSPQAGATVYTAPSAIPSGGTVTVTATSVANPSLSRSATITIVPPIPISVSFFALPPASLRVSAAADLRASISNDVSANPQVKWTVSCGSTDCGAFSPATTASEVAATYTAPATIPSGGTVTVTATSVTDTTKSASTVIAILAVGATLADGSYVFQIPGLSDLGASFTTGVFTAKGGVITGGEQDADFANADAGAYSVTQQITGGSYETTPDGSLQVSLQLAGNPTGELLTGTLTAGASGFANGVEGANGVMSLEPRSSNAGPAGAFAILLHATDVHDGPSLGGILNIDGAGSISGAGSAIDMLQAFQESALSIAASTVSSPDAYGRVVIHLNATANNTFGVGPISIAAYMIDAQHMRLMLIGDPNHSNVIVGPAGGVAFAQGSNAGGFSQGVVAGSSYVFGAAGLNLQIAGAVTLNADGTATGMLNWNDENGSSPQDPMAFKGTYSVAGSGRISLNQLTDGSSFHYSLNLYLDGNGNGLVLSSDVNNPFAGQAFRQQSSTLGPAAISGTYGLNASLETAALGFPNSAGAAFGPITATSNDQTATLAGYIDTGNGTQNFATSGTFAAVSNGIFTGTLNGFEGVFGPFSAGSLTAQDSFTLYMADPATGVMIRTNNPELMLGRLTLAK